MYPRLADDRVGYFTVSRFDFADDTQAVAEASTTSPAGAWRRRIPRRALSEPKQPIVFWLDNNIPEKYRPTIVAGSARMEQGVREDRLQGRDRGEDPARRRRLGHARRAARVDPLDDHRAAVVRRHRSVAGRSAHGRDPRRRHRHRPGAPAQPPLPARRADSRSGRSCAASRSTREYLCQARRTTRRRSRASRSTSSKPAATSSPTVPRRSGSCSTT